MVRLLPRETSERGSESLFPSYTAFARGTQEGKDQKQVTGVGD